jgi:hypothetical protein
MIICKRPALKPAWVRELHRQHPTAFCIYLVVSLLLVGWPVLTHPATVHIGLSADPAVMMWCMVWWPYAIAHLINPFICHMIWAPTGFNLTWATSIPAVALALAPVTLVFGPVVSYNLAALLAPILSACSAFALCRSVSGNFLAAVVGGLLYGFSPYELGHVLGGHLSLSVNFVPPLCLLAITRLLDGSIPRRTFVLVLAALLVVQSLISTEVLATMTAFGGICWLGAYCLFPTRRRRDLRVALTPVAAAYLVAGTVLLPFLYFAFAHSAAPRQPLFPPSFFSADLLSVALPTRLLFLAPDYTQALTARFNGNIYESEYYLGLPFLVITVGFFWSRRSEAWTRLSGLMLLVISIATLGPVLHVAGRPIMRLPWAAAFRLPLIRQALPVRSANYAFLILALIVCMSLSEAILPFGKVLVAYGLAALLPNPLLFWWPSQYQDPAFFSKGFYRKVLHPGENIVIFPYGVSGASMVWQAESGMYFSMSGGYLGPTPNEFLRWPLVNAALFSLPLPDPVRQFRSFLIAHRVEAIVAADGAGPLPEVLGIAPVKLGGVSVYRLPRTTTATVSDPGPDRLEEAAAAEWLATLLRAAHSFLAAGHDVATMNPAELRHLGLLPDSKWGRTLDLVLAGATHGSITGLWLGPGPRNTIAVGLLASPAAAASLADSYQRITTAVFYPYPAPFTTASMASNQVDFMLMTIPIDSVRCAAWDAPSPSAAFRASLAR